MSLSGLLFTSLIATPSADAHPSSGSFDVRFQDCTEFVGIAELSLEDAEKLVPEEFTVQLNDLGSASLVVRTVDCEGISVGTRRLLSPCGLPSARPGYRDRDQSP